MFKDRQMVLFVAVSVLIHVIFLGPLALFHISGQLDDLKIAIETVFAEERPPEDFTRELSVETDISQNLQQISGGAVTAAVAGGSASSAAVAQTKIESAETLKDPEVAINIGDVDIPGEQMLGDDLGEAEITGEVSAVVEGYGPAMSRLAQELLRMMREDKVTVVWLFDQSESMKDDQREIREQFIKIYEELRIAQDKDEKLKDNNGEVLLTAIHEFGKETRAITAKPTSKIQEIRSAIDKIKTDPTGAENMCAAIGKAIDDYRKNVTQGRRKLVVIVVSDESGDDGETAAFEETLVKAKRLSVPVYILGREAVFGFPHAHIRWRDPKFGLEHWLRINRGPETPRVEALQFNGLERRWDSYSSGFGPYEQARLCRDSGGIFFVLPSEEQNLVNADAIERRKFAFLDLKEYQPELLPRRQYEEIRDKSPFRKEIFEVIRALNPDTDDQLTVRMRHFSITKSDYLAEIADQAPRARRTLQLMNEALRRLEKIRPLRDREESQRWRANYDLVLAQILAYRVRMFQYMLTLDALARDFKKPPEDPARPKAEQPNQWWADWSTEIIEPTPEQVKLTGVDLAEIQQQQSRAREMFEQVIKQHPRTPWANRAEWELGAGFGIRLRGWFWDPNYGRLDPKDFPTL